jgi:hypothetical protein
MSVSSAQPLLRARPARIDVLVVGLATTYVTVSTVDAKVAGVPLKLLAVMAALGTWLVAARPWRRMAEFRFRIPVLLTGVCVPVIWFALAAYLSHTHDPAQPAGLSNAVQESSRFVYVLLYFPLADRRWLGAGWERLWIWPAFLLCAITMGLFAGHLLGADYGPSGTVGPFQGSIGVNASGTFRDFLISDIALLPLFAVLVARLPAGTPSRPALGGIVLVLVCAYLAHARGLWVGIWLTVAIMALASMPRRWPARLRRAAWWLAALTGVGGLVVLSDPDVARGLVRLLTSGNELSTTLRLDQAPQLLHGFGRDVFAGSGLGATLPSGFVRDPSTPWTFELTYLQLLFEVGVVGLVLVLAPAVACMWRTARSLLGSALSDRPLGFATLGGLCGFLLAAAGNPYLLTSVGMYTLAVFVALSEREMADPKGALIERTGSALAPNARLASFGAVVLAVLTLTALEFRATRTAAPLGSRAQPVGWTVTLQVPARARGLLRQSLASEPADQRLWSFAIGRGRVTATPLAVVGGRIDVGPARDLGPATRRAVYQVGAWHGRPAAFELIGHRSSLKVRVVSLNGHARVLAEVSGGLPALTRGWHRDLALTTASSGTTVAVAVDRSPAKNRLRLSEFAVVPGGQPRTLKETGVLGPFTPARWGVHVGSVSTAGPDLDLIGAPAGAALQIHVLTSSSDYAAFGEQRTLGLPARGPFAFLIGHRAGSPVLYAVDRERGTVEEIGL